MNFIIADDHEQMSVRAAHLIVDEVRRDPRLLIGAATGSTPTRTYKLLGEMAAAEACPFAEVRLLKVDEWGGLAMDDRATCEVYLQEKLVQPLSISPDRYLAWNSHPNNPDAECQRISRWLAEHGPLGLCILGMGTNGHLAFNEPGDWLHPGPHVARLSSESLRHPMLNASTAAPSYGLTIGIADILRSRRILLLVSGGAKTAQLSRLTEPTVTTRFPASFLWLHPDVTILCDRQAAKEDTA
jgi:galactosamine-6-phosphate isomerase